MKCFCCEEEIFESDRYVTDGDTYLCEVCARIASNQIYNNMLKQFEERKEVYRKAFLTFGWDDLAYVLDEEKENG